MERTPPSVGRLLVLMAAFVVVGGPIAYFMWHELSTLLYGRIERVRWSVLLGAVALFAGLLWVLSRFVHDVTDSHSEGRA